MKNFLQTVKEQHEKLLNQKELEQQYGPIFKSLPFKVEDIKVGAGWAKGEFRIAYDIRESVFTISGKVSLQKERRILQKSNIQCPDLPNALLSFRDALLLLPPKIFEYDVYDACYGCRQDHNNDGNCDKYSSCLLVDRTFYLMFERPERHGELYLTIEIEFNR